MNFIKILPIKIPIRVDLSKTSLIDAFYRSPKNNSNGLCIKGLNTLKFLSLVGKIASIALIVAAPFGNHPVGLYVFADASIQKDVVYRIGDVMDDGKENGSFKG